MLSDSKIDEMVDSGELWYFSDGQNIYYKRNPNPKGNKGTTDMMR